MRDLTCIEVADSAPGFALDILDPEVRSRVAAHLIRCPDCRRTVSGMEESAAQLLGPGIGGDPGIGPGAGSGWEPEGWTADEDAPVLRPSRRRFRTAVTMAAAAVLFVGSTFGPEIGQLSRTGEKPLLSAPLMAGSQAVGTVHLYAGQPATIGLEADGLAGRGPLGVVLASSEGTAAKVGEVHVYHGHAAWLGRNPLRSGRPTGLILVDADLHEVASAALR